MKRPFTFILLFVMAALVFSTGTLSAQSGKRSKKLKAVKPAYITSPPIRVKSYIRKGKVVRAFTSALTDIHVTIEDTVVEGDKIAARCR
jgi:hypothetical protein